MLADLIRPLFAADSGVLAGEGSERLERPPPMVATMLERAEDDRLAFHG